MEHLPKEVIIQINKGIIEEWNQQKNGTKRNEQEGLMHMCLGLMKSIRNLVEHEPQLERKISRDDALDILTLISFLYKQIDKTTYFKI